MSCIWDTVWWGPRLRLLLLLLLLLFYSQCLIQCLLVKYWYMNQIISVFCSDITPSCSNWNLAASLRLLLPLQSSQVVIVFPPKAVIPVDMKACSTLVFLDWFSFFSSLNTLEAHASDFITRYTLLCCFPRFLRILGSVSLSLSLAYACHDWRWFKYLCRWSFQHPSLLSWISLLQSSCVLHFFRCHPIVTSCSWSWSISISNILLSDHHLLSSSSLTLELWL